MKSRDVSLDIIRILACCMVVLMHSPIPSADAPGPFLTALSYLTAPCIGLFFMVSGALLLPVRQSYPEFLSSRMGRILGPTLFWTAVYVVLKLYQTPESVDLIRTIISLPFVPQGNGILWFMYTLTGLYLLAPIISPWIEKASQRDMQIVLILWAITLCYPIIGQWAITNEANTGILYYFGGYAGYFLLGCYLRRYPRTLSLTAAIAIGALGAALLLTIRFTQVQVDFYRMFWYLSIFVAALCVAVWLTATLCTARLRLASTPFITTVSNLTFGVYLSHILIMRGWVWHTTWIAAIPHYALQTFVVAVVTLILSLFLCALLSRLPGAQWIIGYKK